MREHRWPSVTTSSDLTGRFAATSSEEEKILAVAKSEGYRPPSDTTILEYCQVNLRTQAQDFRPGCLVWLPVDEDTNDVGDQELSVEQEAQEPIPILWVPARLKWGSKKWGINALKEKSMEVQSLLPMSQTKSPGVLYLEVEEWRRCLIEKFGAKFPTKSIKKQHLAKLTHKYARKTLKNAHEDQECEIEYDSKHQKVRLNSAMRTVAKKYIDAAKKYADASTGTNTELTKWQKVLNDSPSCSTPTRCKVPTYDGMCQAYEDEDKDVHFQDSMEALKFHVGKSSFREFDRPGYEQAYLAVHGALYFIFLLVMFVGMIAINSYGLMQFFFLFLWRKSRDQENSNETVTKNEDSWFFVYFFFMPYLLMFLSVIGFEVSLLIRSSVATPQLARPRALIAGLFMRFFLCCQDHKSDDDDAQTGRSSVRAQLRKSLMYADEEADDDIPWNKLARAVAWVDTWFTCGLDFGMCFGAICSCLHAVLKGQEDFGTHPPGFYYKRLAGAGLITYVVVQVLHVCSNQHAPDPDEGKTFSERLRGRILHWESKHLIFMSLVLYIAVFLAIVNKEVAYEGVIMGGCVWAVFTNLLYILSDMFVSPGQREFMTLMETTLFIREIKPGHMSLRWFEIRTKLEQQLMISKINPSVFQKKQPSQQPALQREHSVGKAFKDLKDVIEKFLQDPCNCCTKMFGCKGVPEWVKLIAVPNILWCLAYWLSRTPPSFIELYVVVIVSGLSFWWLTKYVMPSVVLLVAVIVARLFFLNTDNHDDEMLKSVRDGLSAAFPALLLIPVMAFWHKLIVRWMPSISQGSAKVTYKPTGFHLNIYHALMAFYSFGSVMWFLIGILNVSAPMTTHQVHQMGMNYNETRGRINTMHDAIYPAYPVCKMHWGAPGLDLGVIDMAILSKYAYANHTEDFQAGIEESFLKAGIHGLDHVKIESITDFSQIPRLVAVQFNSTHYNHDKGANETFTTIVLAIKGTSTPSEAFADASFYSGVAILGVISQVVDIFDLVPNTLIGFLLNHLRLPLVRLIEDQILWSAVERVMALKEKYKHTPGFRIVITGHSLGGGIAGAVGAITSTDAITFSSPGAHFNRFVFHNNFQRQWRNLVNIWPDTDVVPEVDRHDEFLQRIACKDPDGGKNLPQTECHLITTTICELWRVCGDPRGRQMKVCSDPKIGKKFTTADYNSKTWGMYIRPNYGTVRPEKKIENFVQGKTGIMDILPWIVVMIVLLAMGVCACGLQGFKIL